MYGARQRPSHLIWGLCPSITDTTFALQFPHMLIIHAVLEHDVSLEDVARSRRVVAPSGTVLWRLPDRRELAVLGQVTDYRSGAEVRPEDAWTRNDPSGVRRGRVGFRLLSKLLSKLVPRAGVEPARALCPTVFELLDGSLG